MDMKTLELKGKNKIKTFIKNLPATSTKKPQIMLNKYFCYCMETWKSFILEKSLLKN